jgi:hypothetical protein
MRWKADATSSWYIWSEMLMVEARVMGTNSSKIGYK